MNYIIHTFEVFFGWPLGAVWGNFAADAVALIFGGRWLRNRLEKHHQEKLAQAANHHNVVMAKLHEHHEQHMEKLDELRQQRPPE